MTELLTSLIARINPQPVSLGGGIVVEVFAPYADHTPDHFHGRIVSVRTSIDDVADAFDLDRISWEDHTGALDWADVCATYAEHMTTD